MTALHVRGLRVASNGLSAVDGVDLDLDQGSRTGLVGESGSGKSLTALAIMRLLPEGFRAEGSVAFSGGADLLSLSEKEMARLRGEQMTMVFQEPMTALNPVIRVGTQVAETIRLHRRVTRAAAQARARLLLEQVGLPDPDDKLRAYPHQLSGGQRQRVMLAMAIALEPKLIIADEPTTALDVSVQAQILELIDELLERTGATLLLITHDLPVVRTVCTRVLVMYGGRIVERGPTEVVLQHPRHPYTRGLLDAVPSLTHRRGRLSTIPGTVPPLGGFPTGCVFRSRCARATDECLSVPALTGDSPGNGDHAYACWHPLDD